MCTNYNFHRKLKDRVDFLLLHWPNPLQLCSIIMEAVSKMMPCLPILKRNASSSIPFLTESSHNGKNEQEDENISDLFAPVVKTLRVLGTCPLTIEESKNPEPGQGRKYLMQWLDWKAVGSILVGIWFLILWFFFIWIMALRGSVLGYSMNANNTCSRMITDHLRRYREGRVGLIAPETITWVSHFTIPAAQIMDILFGWIYSAAFARFLNKFSGLESFMTEAFASNKNWSREFVQKIRRCRNKLLVIYVVLPTVAFGALLNWSMTAHVNLVGRILVTIYVLQSILVPLLEDAKVILSYIVFSKMFQQVKDYCKTSEDSMEGEKSAIKMKNSRKIILMIRDLCEDCCNWQKNRELMIVFNSIFTITSSMYMLFYTAGNMMSDSETVRYKLMSAGFGAVLIGRIYVKVLVAEKITKQEKELANHLQMTATDFSDVIAASEAKTTYELLLISPTKMCLGNYVVLDKGLLLKIFYLVVTYLIVLAQFTMNNSGGLAHAHDH